MLREAIEALVLMLSPFAPHMAEELWEQLGHAGGLVRAPAGRRSTPTVAKADEVVVPVQVNGKVRGAGHRAGRRVAKTTMRDAALADPAVAAHLAGQDGREGRRGQGRLVSIVVR